MKILITGATGLVGKKLVNKLLANNHEVIVLSRNPVNAVKTLGSNVKAYSWPNHLTLPPSEAFKGIDGIVHLMGENIGAKRWSNEQKAILKSSRIDATKNLVTVINQNNIDLKFFISASAIGIYPISLDKTFNENSELGNGFLPELCQEWENASQDLPASTRKVYLRTSVVLDKTDGALKKMLPPFYMGVGGILGNGKQAMSWIHIDDLVNLYVKAIEDENFKGAYNACSPNPVSNYEFTKALGKAISRPTLFPVPEFVIKTMFGEMSSIILDSQKVVSSRLSERNFQFQYPKIDEAFKKIFN